MITFKENIEPHIRKFEELLGLSFKVFLMTAIVVTVLGIYVANLLFGNHSLRILNNLKTEKIILKKEISKLKNENASLHKQYLEWTDAK